MIILSMKHSNIFKKIKARFPRKILNALRKNNNITSYHVEFIDQLSKFVNPSSYCEIGIYEAETFNRVCANKKIAVDISEQALSYINMDSNTTKIKGNSSDLDLYLRKNNILLDLVFIDANHEKDHVIEDFANVVSHVAKNGIVLLHDTFPETREYTSQTLCGTAYLAISELRMKYTDWSFVTIPIHPGLTIAIHNESAPLWVQ